MPGAVTRSARAVAIGRVALLVAALSLVWTAWLVVFGGFDINVSGVRLKSNEPLRAFTAASLAIAVYAATHGLAVTFKQWTDRLTAFDTRLLAAALAIATCGVGVIYSTTAATGTDAYGYVSQADLWLAGRLTIPQPWASAAPWPAPEWTFAPVGYRPGSAPGIVPIYPPGLPLLMAGMKGLAGHEALFWIVPICGALLVLATFGIGCRLGSRAMGLGAAWLVATSPAVLFMLMQPMSDVPAAAAWAIAIYFALGSTTSEAAASGLATAMAILIRPNLAPLAGALALKPVMLLSDKVTRGVAIKQLAAVGAVAALGPLAIAMINSRLYGSPLTSGYGDIGTLFAASHVLPNLQRYLAWLAGSQTPIALAGLVAILVPMKWLWPRVADRRVFVMMAAFVLLLWAQYLAYAEYEVWWFLRFLLPSWPLIMLGIAALAAAAARRIPPAFTLVVVWLIFMLGANGLQTAAVRGTFDQWRWDRRHIDVVDRIRNATDESSIIYTSYQSGSLRYYGSRQTLRFDFLAGDWLDRSIEWFAAHRIHPYVIFVTPEEAADFKRQFAGQQAAERLDPSLIFAYTQNGREEFWFYDLLPGGAHAPRVEPSGDLARLRSVPPVPTPPLNLTP